MALENLTRLVQTEGTYVSRQAQGAELSREGFDEYELDALDDARTCAVCRGIEHRAFRFDDMAVGQNYPPLHPRCRCAVNPHVADWDAWVRGQADERRAEAAARRLGVGSGGGSPHGKMELVEGARFDTSNPEDVEEFIREFGERISDAPVEHAYVLQRDGSVLHSVGDAETVYLNGADLDGAYAVHNHPPQDGEYESFGPDDFTVLRANQAIAKLVAFSGRLRFEVKVARDISKLTYNQGRRYVDTRDIDDLGFQHAVMKGFADAGFLEYRWRDADSGWRTAGTDLGHIE